MWIDLQPFRIIDTDGMRYTVRRLKSFRLFTGFFFHLEPYHSLSFLFDWFDVAGLFIGLFYSR